MTRFDNTACALGEGPLWHPVNNALYWFDILSKKMFCKTPGGVQSWTFKEHVSAAGWVDTTTLLIASETGLWRFDLTSGTRDLVVHLEADNPVTRSNDGRADPWGGFWIGTMGKQSEPYAGAIYRYHKGKLRQITDGITVSNSICFAPDRSCAYYADTLSRQIMRQPLDDDGWPKGTPDFAVDLKPDGLNPDGAVTDAQGNIWVALWGAARVACFDANGTHLRDIAVPATQTTCPAFGGPDLRDLIVTSAAVGLSANPDMHDGCTFVFKDIAQGYPEPKVIL